MENKSHMIHELISEHSHEYENDSLHSEVDY